MRIILVLFLLFSTTVFSQVQFDKTRHDFGDLESYDERFVDIVLTNKGQKKEYVLSVKKPFDVTYIVNGKFMDKDSSVVVRLQVNPKTKGKFSYDVDIFTSDRNEPVKVKLTGNLKEIPQNDLSGFTACPDFSSRPGGARKDIFKLTVVTIDKDTKQELADSRVTMIQNGQAVWTHSTDKNGKIKEDGTLGFTYFYAKKEAYKPAEMGAYVNFQRNLVVIELEMDPSYCPPPPRDTPPIQPYITQEEPTRPEITLEQTLTNENPTPFIAATSRELSQLDPDDFSAEHFAPVNVVFVLDISSSMAQGDRLELMKYSLFQLVDMLRPEDKVGLVTYATDTRVILTPTSAGDKEKIKSEVTRLKASGLTAGGTGIKLGYKQALKGYLPNGVNQVIVITDGAFNRNSEDYEKYVKKYKKKGVNLSVVGIQIKEPDRVKLTESAELGGGRLVPVMKLADAQNNLRQEIRFMAFRK
jgi:Ca-activated chloride channel family protein